ncbi:MAG: outer membrane beta-barrel protein [Bacteroidia bacterium]|nr:outer membrane beta-barrel protein [Bacteroidia bacterium]MDW8133646.1 outer membrane beta-barrel protein [Bacteroidia bacterium]
MRVLRKTGMGLALLITGLYAQEGVKFGIRVSPGLGFFSLDSLGRTVRNLGGQGVFNFVGGLMLSFGFSDNVAFLIGAGVGTAGGKIEYRPNYGIYGKTLSGRDTVVLLGNTGLSSATTVTYRITTIGVPVWIKMRTNTIGPTPLRAKALLGGQADIRVGSSTNSDKKILSANFIDQERTRTAEHFGQFLACGSFGAGVDVDLEGIGVIDFAVIYNHGLVNFLDKEFKFDEGNVKDLQPYKELKARLSSLQFNLIFWF